MKNHYQSLSKLVEALRRCPQMQFSPVSAGPVSSRVILVCFSLFDCDAIRLMRAPYLRSMLTDSASEFLPELADFYAFLAKIDFRFATLAGMLGLRHRFARFL
jgi:hypothetical protein